MQLIAHFALAFAAASPLNGLTSLHRATRGVMMQKARHQAFPLRGIALLQFVGARVQVLFTPLTGVLFNIRSRYSYAIGRQGILSLGGWSPRIRTRFHVTGPTREPIGRVSDFAYGTITLYRQAFQTCLAIVDLCHSTMMGPTTPQS